jgi:hypothetical protein
MQVWWFLDVPDRVTYQGNVVILNSTPDLPAPPYGILVEHLRQAVLANMRGGGGVQVLDFDRDDTSSMRVFEGGEGRVWLETYLQD